MQHPVRVVVRTARFEAFEERLALTAQPWACSLPVPGTSEPWDERMHDPLRSFASEVNAEADPGSDAIGSQDNTNRSTGTMPIPLSTGVSAPADQTVLKANRRDLPGQRRGLDGSGQTVAIIDSGIAYDHPALGGGLGTRYQVVGGWDFAERDSDPYDDAPFGFHGTHIAGIIASQSAMARGVAPGVDLVALRVFDDQGMGQWEWVEQALQWVETHRNDFAHPITTVNLSVGSLPSDPANSQWQILEDEFQRLRDAGIFVVVAAGNSFTDQPTTGLTLPAASRWVVPVASVDDQGRLSSFSQRQSQILAAPGERILSTVPDYLLGRDGDRNDFDRASGTSMAAPFVAGASVLVRQAMERSGINSITPDLILQHLRASAVTHQDSQTGIRYYELDLDNALERVVAPQTAAAPTPPVSSVAAISPSTGAPATLMAPGSVPPTVLGPKLNASPNASTLVASKPVPDIPAPPANKPGGAPPIVYGPVFPTPTPTMKATYSLNHLTGTQAVRGSLNHPQQRDTFSFSVLQNGTVTVTVISPLQRAWKLGQVGAITPPTNAELRLHVRTGTTYLVSFEAPTSFGSYELRFQFVPAYTPIELGRQTSWSQTKVPAGVGWYRVTAAHHAVLTVSAKSISPVDLKLYSENLQLLHQAPQTNRPRIDTSAVPGQSYLVQVSSQANEFDLSIVNSVSSDPGVTTIRGGTSDDAIEIKGASLLTIRVNGLDYMMPHSEQIVVQAAGGTDTVRIVGLGKHSIQLRDVEVTEDIDAIAYHLSRDLRLSSLRMKAPHTSGTNERWFVDPHDQRYFMTSTGQLYRWNGTFDLTKSHLIAQLDETFYRHVEQFLQATRPQRLSESEAAYWSAHLNLQRIASDHKNWGGRQERWLRGANQQMIFITPDGNLYRWSGKRDLSGSTLLTQLDTIYYQDLQRLVVAATTVNQLKPVQRVVSALQLQTATPELDNRFGLNERWLRAADGNRYFLSPSGAIYRMNGQGHATHQYAFAASVGSYFHPYSEQLLVANRPPTRPIPLSIGRGATWVAEQADDPAPAAPAKHLLRRATEASPGTSTAQQLRFSSPPLTNQSTAAAHDRVLPHRLGSSDPSDHHAVRDAHLPSLIDLITLIRRGQLESVESVENWPIYLDEFLDEPPVAW